MNKFFLAVTLLFFLVSCSEESKMERYFANCVKDVMKVKKLKEPTAVQTCTTHKTYFPDKFKYYKGKIASEKR